MRYLLLFSLVSSMMALGCDDSSDGGTVPLGESCSPTDSCVSGLSCVDFGQGAICAQSCDAADASSCPEGFSCNSSYCQASEQGGGTEVPVGGTETPVGGTEMPMGGTMTGGTMPATGLSCSEVFDCFETCGDANEACANECINQATPEAQGQLGALANCFNNANCAEGDNECLAMACGGELNACLAGGGGGGGGGTPGIPAPEPGSLSCGAALICVGARQCQDIACQTECEAGVSPQEAAALTALNTCASTNMCQNRECVETSCSAELAACTPPGDLSCGGFFSCASACGQDIYCVIECQVDLSEDGLSNLETLDMCAQMNGCMSYQDCPACADQLNACMSN